MKVSNEDLKKLLLAIDKTDDALSKLEGKEAASSPKKPGPKTMKPKTQKVTVKKTAKKAAPKSTPAKPSN